MTTSLQAHSNQNLHGLSDTKRSRHFGFSEKDGMGTCLNHGVFRYPNFWSTFSKNIADSLELEQKSRLKSWPNFNFERLQQLVSHEDSSSEDDFGCQFLNCCKLLSQQRHPLPKKWSAASRASSRARITSVKSQQGK